MTKNQPHKAALDPQIYVAIDQSQMASAQSLVDALSSFPVGFKLGLEFYLAHGIEGVSALIGDRPLFLDLKFHDIPNTVAGAVRSVSSLKPRILNVHASGGRAMMRAAKAAALETGLNDTKLIAVTVLTSLDQQDLSAVGFGESTLTQALRLAKLAAEAGLDGVVCSAQEAKAIHEACGEDFLRLTPGIRAAQEPTHDQKRAVDAKQVFDMGASHIVVGRMISQSPDPAQAMETLLTTLENKLA